MAKGMNAQELANKLDWEGGLYEGAFGYGITPDDIDDSEVKLKAAWTEMCTIHVLQFRPALKKVADLLPEPGEDED